MALETQYVQIALAEGIDTKTDEKLVAHSKLIGLINGKLAKTGTVQKRDGYFALSTSLKNVTGTESVTSGEALGVFKKEALMFSDGLMYSVSEGVDGYISRGRVNSVVVRERPIYAGSLGAASPDFAINGSIQLTAWIDSRGVVASAVDLTTQTTLFAETVIRASGTLCRVVSLGSFIYIFSWSAASANIFWSRLDTIAQPGSILGTGTMPSSAIDTGRLLFDIVSADANTAAYAYSRSGGGITFGIFNGALTVPSVSQNDSSISNNADNCLTVLVSPMNKNIWVGYFTSTIGIRSFVYSYGLAAILAPTTVVAQTQPAFTAISGEFNSETSVTWVYEQGATSIMTFLPAAVTIADETILLAANNLITGQEVKFTTTSALPSPLVVGTSYFIIDGSGSIGGSGLVKLATTKENAFIGTAINITDVGVGTQTLTVQGSSKRWTSIVKYISLLQAGTVGTAVNLIFGAEIASKVFKNDGTLYVALVYATDLQPTYFLIDIAASDAIAKLQTYRAGHVTTTGSVLPKVLLYEDSKFIFPALSQTAIVTEEDDFFANRKIVLAEVDFGSDDRYFNAPLGNNLLIAGGYLSAYDGVSIVEHGFHLFPEYIDGAQRTTGGSIAAGTYLYAFLYEWFDQYGQRHQSAPSVIFGLTTTGTTSSTGFVVEVPRITQRKGAIQQARVIMYRSLVGGTIFFRVTPQKSATDYTITNHTQTFLDTALDATISSNEVLYTSTGEVENIAPPACSLITTNKNRGFIVSSEDPTAIFYSKINGIGPNAVGFSDFFVKRVDQVPGDIRAIETMDDKIIQFKKNNMLFFAGDGPLNTGEQDTYSEVQLIASDDGTNEPTSVGASAEGIYFKAENKGIMRLNRNLQTEYVGSDVEGFRGVKILSTDLLARPYEIRFITEDGQALVYDTQQKQWGVYNNHNAVDSAVWNGSYIYLKENGTILKESSALSKDGNLSIPLTIETAWIKLSSIEGFQRVKSLMILGEYFSAHELKVSFAYDYQPYYADSVVWDPTEVLDSEIYGDALDLYGDGIYGGTDDAVYQVRVHVPNQKCQSIKMKIEDISSGDLGRSMSITGLQLECKMKKGVFKLRQEKTAG